MAFEGKVTTTINRLNGTTSRSSKEVGKKTATVTLQESKKAAGGKRENKEHFRAIVNRENLGLIISKQYFLDKSDAFKTLNNANPQLFNEMYTSIVAEIDRAFPLPFPTDPKNIGSKVYNYRRGKERLIIALSKGDSGTDNFARIQGKFSTSIKRVERKYRNRIDSTIENILILNSFLRVFKGSVTRVKGKDSVKAKDFAAKLVNRYAKPGTFIGDAFKDAGISLPFRPSQLDTAYLKKTNKTGNRNYDIIFSAFLNKFEDYGLLQDVRVGLELGHIGGLGGRLGPNVGPSSPGELRLLAMEDFAAEAEAVIDEKFLQDVGKARKEFETETIDIEILRSFSQENQDVNVILVFPESNESNNLDSKVKQKVLDTVTDKVRTELPGITGSVSMLEFIELSIIAAFTGKKIKTVRDSRKNSTALYENTRAKKSKPRKVKLKPIKTRGNSLGAPKIIKSGINPYSLRNLINAILAKNVEQQMASAGSTDGRLRYQSGRFAESAELLTLTKAQSGVLAGSYTYMKSPYEVFAPGHKMATPQRNPEIYIEGAIRAAAIAILKNKFPGMALEVN